MRRLHNNVYKRILISFIVIFLPTLLIPGFDIISAIFISFGFSITISLWSLSSKHDTSYTFYNSNKANN